MANRPHRPRPPPAAAPRLASASDRARVKATTREETGTDIGPGECIIVGIVLLLVFGSNKIPQLARNLGRAQNELKKSLAEGRDDTPPHRDDHQALPAAMAEPPERELTE